MITKIEKALNNQTRYPSQNNVFLRPGFRRALAREYRLDSVDISITPTTQALWLPGYLKKTAFGRRLIIGAGFEQSGLTTQLSPEHFLSTINALTQTAETHNIQRLEIRTQHTIPCQSDHSDKVELAIQLDTSCAERFQQFSKSTRRNLRLPFKHGFYYVIGKQRQQLDDFYQVYQLSMHELGSLPHSKAFFSALWRDCHAEIELFVGYMDEQPVVASFNFLNSDEIYGAWGCAHPAYKKYCVFLTMLWQLLKHCEETGRQRYNLGRTSINSNAYHFKKRLANRERKIHYYQLTPSPSEQQSGAVYAAASWFIRRSPPLVMQALSRHLLHRFY